ncbi:MAG: glycosyltransferase [Bacteroidota bacterium]
MNDLIVSVCMITYNHEKFIAQAIDSVLMQETNFKIELIIGEDNSSDNTKQIVKSYIEKYPDKIYATFNESNIGMMNNFIKTIKNCKGKYVALLEGDDFWTDSYKLQLQIDFLEKNPDFALCFHNINVFNEEENVYIMNKGGFKLRSIFTIKDILIDNFISTVSCVFRNNLFAEFPVWFPQLNMGDWFVHILNAQHGKIKYFKRNMATYRVHNGGVFSGQPKINTLTKTIQSLELFYENESIDNKEIVKKAISKKYFSLGIEMLNVKMKKEALKNVLYSLKLSPLNLFSFFFKYLFFFIKSIFISPKKS